VGAKWRKPFELLRRKWHEVPAGGQRVTTRQLLALADEELLEQWHRIRLEASAGPAFDVRGWYHLLYSDILRGKRVMDVGCGLGIDGVTFAERGGRMTFVDIVQSNLAVVERVCKLLGLDGVAFRYMEDISSLAGLPTDYDVIWCQGSLINAPFHVIRAEAQELLRHLPVGGRWIELAYPKIRWEREGRPPFHEWGGFTDGPGTPWVEWYDLEKLRAALEPAQFDVVLYLEFHNSDFNWFDLVRRA
jgi:SAM-dependent methyltransferase